MIRTETPTDSIRHKIESLGTRLSLPTVIRALGILEGEHPSSRRGSGYDYLDIRPYEPGEEARLIDWKASARSARPMIVDKERESTGNIWLMLDVGREMNGLCPNGERAVDVAANALRMFAMLSLRRSDDLSIVTGDSANITRVPFNGGFARFEHVFDGLLNREMTRPRDFDAMIDYASRIRNRRAMVVLATDETAWSERHMKTLRTICQTHPLVVVSVSVLNPFEISERFDHVIDARDGRRLPAFMRREQTARDVSTHREFVSSSLEHELVRARATMIRSGSSEQMFNEFVSLVSNTLAKGSAMPIGGLR